MKHYTFIMSCNFQFQYTFTEDEVQPEADGGRGDFGPTEDALAALTRKVEAHLGSDDLATSNVDVVTDGDYLLGVMEDDAPGDHGPRTPPVSPPRA